MDFEEIQEVIDNQDPNSRESHGNVKVWNYKDVKITRRKSFLLLEPFWYIRDVGEGVVYAGESLKQAYEKYNENS